MHTRAAVPDDAEAIAAINVTGWQAAYAGLMPAELLDAMEIAPRVPRMRAWLGRSPAERLDRPGDTLVVVDDADTVLGYAHYGAYRLDRRDTYHPTDGEIHAIYVRPDTWGCGAGTVLIRAALAELAGAGRSVVRLWVLAGNDRARRFYERRGFAADGATRVDRLTVAGGTTDVPEVRYTHSG